MAAQQPEFSFQEPNEHRQSGCDGRYRQPYVFPSWIARATLATSPESERAECLAERFHIAEWYGRPFLELTDAERRELALHKVGGSVLKKPEVTRLIALEAKEVEGTLTPKETARLAVLRQKLEEQRQNEQPCPFRTDTAHATCTKPGGVCSLQLLSDDGGQVHALSGERGMVRATCPFRFHQGNTVFRHIGERLLSDPDPKQMGEVGFLKSTGNLDSEPGADVGYIDMILASPRAQPELPLQWAPVEIQAVYFSGKEMPIEFRHITKIQGALSMPQEARRPDYRSSGPKRLMPQLQIKVPTLRRWGKKMAVVVDVPFFKSMGEMRTVNEVSNADIVWYLVDFLKPQYGAHRELIVVDELYTTLESAIEGLTGGVPVSLAKFEGRIEDKIG